MITLPESTDVDFIALDVETANPDLASICQIGVVAFSNWRVCSSFKTYIDPEDFFDGFNVSVHGITSDMIKGSPTFGSFIAILRPFLANQIVVHHTAFDRASLDRAAQKYNQPGLSCRWLDSARVARRTWEECRQSGYGLSALASRFKIEFNNHDALEDARAAGLVFWKAIQESGISAEEWLRLAYKKTKTTFQQEGNPDGSLAGEVIVFTGALSIPRKQAAKMAADAGCDVADNVNKETTLLVVGDQDIRKLAGNEKSSKHRKAEMLIESGLPIRILTDHDFMAIINNGLD